MSGYIDIDPPSSDGAGEVSASGRDVGGSVILIGLSPFTCYPINVVEYTDFGHGTFSSVITEFIFYFLSSLSTGKTEGECTSCKENG